MSLSALARTAIDLQVFQAMPGNSIVLLPDTPVFTIVAATDDYYATSGKTKEELINIGMFDAFPASPDDPEQNGVKQLRSSLEKVIQQKAPDRMPLVRYDVKNEDGTFTERYWSAVNKPVIGENGEVLYIIYTAEEMTLQVKAEHSANRIKSLEKSYDLFMQAPVTIGVVKGPEYIIELANDNLLEVWGRTADVIGKSLFEAIPELEEQGFRQLLDQVCKTGEPYHTYEHPIHLNRYGKQEVVYFDFVYKPYYENKHPIPVGVLAVGHNVTKQVESRQKFKSVIEEAKDPILILMGEDLVLDTANQALFDLWQVGPEASGKAFLQILPEMANQGFADLLRNVLRTGEPFYGKEVPAVFKRRSGIEETVYFDFSYQPYRNTEGTITGVLVMATDVSTKVLARKKLEESEKRFRSMADASPVIIWTLDEEGNSTYYNSRAREFTGHTEEDLAQGKSWQVAIHPDDIDYAAGVVTNAVIKRIPYEMECRMQNAKGEWRWLLNHGTPRFGGEGEYFGFVGSSVDITERKLAEEALLYRKALLEAQNNAIPDAILIVDTRGGIISYNHQFTKLWKIPRAIIDAKDDAAALEFAMTQVADPKAFIERVTYCYEHPDEKAHEEVLLADGRIIERYGNAVIGDEGTNYGWIWYFRDITQQKQFTERLEKLVTERTKALQQSNDSLQQFAHVASHDLKEPVRKIKTFTGRLEEELQGVLNEKSRIYLDKVRSATERMYLMIDGVLTYSTINASQQALQTVHLNDVLKSIETDLEVLIQQTDTEIFYKDLPSIEGSYVLLYQLFYNLVNNAIKFARDGVPPVISIGASIVKTEGHEFAQILVNDNGIAFEQEQAEKIFETFTRLHSKDKYEGTGLGLSLCKRIVERHGGSIQAKGRLHEGATFIISLPVKQTSSGI